MDQLSPRAKMPLGYPERRSEGRPVVEFVPESRAAEALKKVYDLVVG
jgi:hypothetical protein